MILVVGVDGLIGGNLYRSLKQCGTDVIGTSRRTGGGHLHLDLASPENFQMPRGIDVTVVCAGGGDIAACEASPAFTSLINVSGTSFVAERAAESGSRVVALSSSLVFDGQGNPPGADAAPSPCCEYGRQKAEMESRISGERFAIVRLTKVIETLRPRFSGWLEELRNKRAIAASTALRFSPVSLKETIAALSGLVANFRPGSFHVTGDETFTYHHAASRLAVAWDLDPALVVSDVSAGTNLFQPLPVTANLAPASPQGCSGWNFSPSSSTLNSFLRGL